MMSDEDLFASADQMLAAMDYVSLTAARDEEHRQATAALLLDLLVVADSLAVLEEHCRELAQAGQEQAPLGPVQVVARQINDVLARAGVEPMNAVGGVLDLDLHEVVEARPSAAGDGTVLAELQRGYFWGRTLLRRARVVVAAPPAVGRPEGGADAGHRH